MNVADAARINVLFRKYVGSGPVDLVRLREVIRRETLAAERKQIKVTTGLLRELRADRAFVGHVQGTK